MTKSVITREDAMSTPDDDNARTSAAGAQTLIRGLRVIEALAVTTEPIGVGDLSRSLDLPKSTVQRLLRTLDQVGWAEAVSVPITRWQLTPRLLSLAQSGTPARSLRDIALPHLTALGYQTGETIHFCVPNGSEELVLIERIDSIHPVRTFNQIGAVSQMHNTASGKAWLSTLETAELDKFLQAPVVAMTDDSITDTEVIRAQVLQARELGYAVNLGENRPHVCAVGAVVIGADSKPLATVAISMPDSRFEAARVPEWGAMVAEAVAAIARDF
ncbi:IclR family transcriptional regulator [Nocardia sp. NPDC059228]|uniref:IclR family transcriptional regulator n=1 Tax=Nocardia sp. NPDC059228 TaxID=3346777 RepID=UPI003688F92B